MSNTEEFQKAGGTILDELCVSGLRQIRSTPAADDVAERIKTWAEDNAKRQVEGAYRAIRSMGDGE